MKSHYIMFLMFLLRAISADQNNITNFLQCLTFEFRASNSSKNLIYTPQNPSYSSIFMSSVRNLRPLSTPGDRALAIITPNNESEIQATIRCAKKYDTQIKVRSGGHDYEGLSYISQTPFIIIDMRNLRAISIDTKDNTAWIQTGAQLGEVYYAIGEASRTLAFPAGACPTVGVGGHFTGGGYSMISRKYGLAIDHIIDATIINASGLILDRDSMGEDLFWAIRGGGGTSFGIILAFKVKLVTVPEIVTVFNVSRTSEQNATQLVHKWQYISNNIDENLTIRLFVISVKESSRARTIQVSFKSLFLGRAEDLLRLMEKKFPELGLVEQDCTEMSWVESTVFFANYTIGTPVDVLLERKLNMMHYYKGKSDYVKVPIPEHGLEGLWNYLKDEFEYVKLQFSPYGGILDTISESETPFPHRSGNIFMIHYLVICINTTASERCINWIRRLYNYMAPFVSKSPRTAYFNYRDLDIGTDIGNNLTSYKEASVWGFKYFKNNFNRLVRVKTNVDPSNFFRNEQSIPPLSSYITKKSCITSNESSI